MRNFKNEFELEYIPGGVDYTELEFACSTVQDLVYGGGWEHFETR